MRHPLLSLAVAGALAAAGGAAPARAADWTIDPGKSRLGFTGTQAGTTFTGSFRHWDGHITFDPAHPESGQVQVTIDMTSAATGDKQKDLALPAAEWFDAKAFPQARFTAAGFRAKGGNAYEAPGRLTIRNVEKEVVLPFTLEITGGTAHAQGRLTLLRGDYGVGQGEWASPDWVAPEVAVLFDLTASSAADKATQ